METNFISKQIGKPDLVLKEQIISAYTKLIDSACALELEIEICLNNLSGFGIDFFIEATSNNLETFLKTKFIELNDVNLHGISKARLIESNLLDIDNLDAAIEARKLFDKALSNARGTGFAYSLKNLFVDEKTGWELTEDFYNKVDQKVCQFTKTEQENIILDKMEQLCSVLNDLSELDILRVSRGKFEINKLVNFVDFDRGSASKPYSVSRAVFHRTNL